MLLRPGLLVYLIVFTVMLHAQMQPGPLCAQKLYQQQLYIQHPELKQKHNAIEQKLLLYRQRKQATINSFSPTGTVAVLPVVIHIIHNNGPENISDAQVKQGIAWLNQAYAAGGYYNNGQSTNTQIQFCMAQRDPQGNATTGITRNVSPYTVMGGDSYAADDGHIKSINAWNQNNYINIWLVNSIPTNVVGYSTLPEAHGTPYEGIVMEAAYFGSSMANNVVLIHEIGHYLGLYHTFEGGCTNDNCMTDGDMVCDTPPDQSTAYISCDATMNSCRTDTKSGFNTDQPDLTQDYMDYGNFDCMKVFTPGQVERMNWFLQNELFSLLSCNSCKVPCPTPVKAVFVASALNVPVNTNVVFANHSLNASQFKWFVDGVRASTSKDFSKSFAVQGKHVIMLQAFADDPLCDSSIVRDTITITCPVKAGFDYTQGIIKMNQQVTFTNKATGATSYTWKVNGVSSGAFPGFSYSFPQAGIYTVTELARGVCTDSAVATISVYDSLGHIPQDICKPVTFQKMITTNNQLIWGMELTRDSGYVLCGEYAIPFEDGYGGAYLAKLNKAGSVIWARYVNPFSEEILDRVHENADGSFIACGKEYGINTDPLQSKMILMKFDAKGNVLWAKKLGLPNSLLNEALDITATPDGGYAFCGVVHDDDFKLTDWLVVKTDGYGNIIWSKTLDNGFYERCTSIIIQGDTLVVGGIRALSQGPRSEVVITKMLVKNGVVTQSEVYDIDNRSVNNTTLFKIPGGYLVGAESVQDGFYYADMDQLAMQIDDNLQPIRVMKVAIDIFGSPISSLNPTKDGGFITSRISQGFSNYDQTDSCWIAMAKIDGNWNLDWIKKYPLATADGRTVYMPRSTYPTLDGGYLTGETTTRKDDYAEHFRLIKTDSKGNTPGCPVLDFKADLQTPVLRNEPFAWSTIKDVVLNDPIDNNLAITDNKSVLITSVQRCSTSDCDYVKLKGDSKICSLLDTITYSVDKNAACVSAVLWQTDTTMAQIVSYTDTTIRLFFKHTGKTSLDGTIFTACKLLQDSIIITVSDSSAKLNLGPDIQLCTSSTVKLSAGKGFSTYYWNTGSIDSTLTIYTPGKYYVTVTNNCDAVFSDTVMFSVAPAISLNLTPQQPRCDQDSLQLNAKTGFISYTWSPAYNISSANGAAVSVWPAADTTYTVVAQVNDYCTVTDSVRVKILRSTPIKIGNDTAFCTGGFVILHAPQGFDGYKWQDGSTNQTFMATQKGLYTLSALNTNGCYSKDSMQVTDVYPLPPVNLGRDGRLCLNNTVLHAGGGQASYLWQDGSTDSVYNVTVAVQYWVTVTGNHLCTGSDTISVTGFNPVPSAFLPPDTSFCENGSIQLSPNGNWASYAWSNNYLSRSIIINQAGSYWLQVSDQNDCYGKDTINITVKTDCPRVIYFPNAFTPNGDGTNDVFKPLNGAPLEKYNLAIYNRWGQKIFESNNPLNGWNGNINNTKTPAGAYIYFCSYKFYGDAGGVLKGTVLLLR